MLNLLRVRYLLTAIVSLIALTTLGAAYAGIIGTGDALAEVITIFRLAPTVALILIVLPYTAWRWMPSLQRAIFPYLGGEWAGELEFESKCGTETRPVTLIINHSLLRILLILDSAESTSRTLIVQVDRDSLINRDRLYYVYLNERKEGVAGAGQHYRGLAVLRVEMSSSPTLYGDYFTEQQSRGKIKVERKIRHPWWAIWK